MRTAACIVTHEADLVLLERNLSAVTAQVDLVIIVDNGSSNVGRFRAIAPSGAVLLRSRSNRGLAVAMNLGAREAADRGAEYVLMLDQDSVVDSGLVAGLVDDLSQSPLLAVAAPDFRDRNLSRDHQPTGFGIERVEACITSGSLVRVEDWLRVGGWDESLFVDYIDFDFCLRLRKAGREIVVDHRFVLHHAIGAGRRTRLGVTWGHGPARLERMASDVVRYSRKHRSVPKRQQVVPTGLFRATLMLGRKALLILVYEESKRAKVAALARGYFTGLGGGCTSGTR